MVSSKWFKWAIDNAFAWSSQVTTRIPSQMNKGHDLYVRWAEGKIDKLIFIIRADWEDSKYDSGNFQLIFIDAPKEQNEFDLYSANIKIPLTEDEFFKLWEIAGTREFVNNKSSTLND